MTIEEAKSLGYEVIKASAFEVGLTKNGQGLKTWWCQDFDRKVPELDHPLIQEAIQSNEDAMAAFYNRWPHNQDQ